jgi:hypothetical protein
MCCNSGICSDELLLQESHIVGGTNCSACYANTICYENCCVGTAPVSVWLLMAIVKGKTSHFNPAICRLLRKPEQPPTANCVERDGKTPSSSDNSADGTELSNPDLMQWLLCCCVVPDLAQKGDVVVVHYGPCCHWVCNIVVCPCWKSEPMQVVNTTVRRLKPASMLQPVVLCPCLCRR